MSSRDGFKTYHPGQILAKEFELKEAIAKLDTLDRAFDLNPHKAGSHERNLQMRRWSDQRQKVKELRQELIDMRRAERS